MLVYIMSIPGGMIADKVLGQKAVLLGAIILCLEPVFDLDRYLGLPLVWG
jgi:hypothetical protein